MTSFMSIGGIASGLDTAGIIDQLLQLERRPIQVIQQRQQAHRKADEAWNQIVTKLSSVREAIDGLRDPSSFQRDVTVASSAEHIATATRTGAPQAGATDLRVDQLATAHRAALGGSFASPTDTLGAAGTIALSRADGTEIGEVALAEDATLEEAARALSGLDGVRAQVVKVATGDHRLVVSSERTGAEQAFSVGGDHATLSAGEVLTAGVDAKVRYAGLDISRSTNTIDDLVDGIELQLTGVGDVRITAERDLDASVERVRKLVDSVNGTLEQLATAGRVSQEAGKRGPLASDPLVRSLSMQLRNVVSSVSGEGTYGTPSTIGISLTRDGRLDFDESRLRAALSDDPDAVAAMVSSVSRASDPAVSVTRTGQAQAGSYQLEVTQAATVAGVTGAAYEPPAAGATHAFTVTRGSRTAEIVLTEDDATAAQAAERINAQLAGAGITTVTAGVVDGSLRLEATRAGSNGDLGVTGSGGLGLDGDATGDDAQGTLSDGTDTWTLTGNGTSLRAVDGPAEGLIVSVPRERTGGLGEVAVADGLTSAFDRVLRSAEGRDGTISGARDGLQARIDGANESIERAENRFAIRERMLRAQFTNLESAMGRLTAQGNWLAGQLGGLPG